MKHTKFLKLLLVLLIALTACEEDGPDPDDDDDDDEVPRRTIVVQNWSVGSLTEDGSSGDAQNTTVEFSEGGAYTLIIPGFSGDYRRLDIQQRRNGHHSERWQPGGNR